MRVSRQRHSRHVRAPSQITIRNKAKRRLLIAMGYYLSLQRLHAHVNRLQLNSKASTSSASDSMHRLGYGLHAVQEQEA